MNIPIVFTFDENYLPPTAVAISSLLINSTGDEYYEIICLHRKVSEASLNWLKKLRDKYGRCEFRFIDMKDTFEKIPSLWHITSVSYFRLMIPNLLPEYDKVIYADVDMVFQSGLSEVWNEDLGDYYVAGVMDYFAQKAVEYLKKRGLDNSLYINAGFMLLNNKKIRENNIEEQWLSEIGKPENEIADQDIVNRVCRGRIKPLSLCCNFSNSLIKIKHDIVDKYSEDEINEAFRNGIIHYVSEKPWRGNSVIYPKEYLWWGYYWRLPSVPQKKRLKYYKVFVYKLPVIRYLIYKLRIISILKRF